MVRLPPARVRRPLQRQRCTVPGDEVVYLPLYRVDQVVVGPEELPSDGWAGARGRLGGVTRRSRGQVGSPDGVALVLRLQLDAFGMLEHWPIIMDGLVFVADPRLRHFFYDVPNGCNVHLLIAPIVRDISLTGAEVIFEPTSKCCVLFKWNG